MNNKSGSERLVRIILKDFHSRLVTVIKNTAKNEQRFNDAIDVLANDINQLLIDADKKSAHLQKLCEEQRVEIAKLEQRRADAYKMGIDDGHRCSRNNAELESQLATQTERVKSQDVEIANLRKFAEHMLYQYAWEPCADPDGGDVQDTAEKLGLIELRRVGLDETQDGEIARYFPVWEPWTQRQLEQKALNQDSLGDEK